MSIPIATIASAVLSLRGLTWVAFIFLVSYCIYSLHIKPLLSPLRHLPAPKQGFLWFRLLKEPKAVEIERWMDELPHDGLFRYYGIFNRQRIFTASPKATADLLHGPNAFKYIKPKLQFILANNIAGKGLLIQEREENKHARKGLIPAFNPDQIRKSFPDMWKTAVETIEALPNYTEKMALGDNGCNSTEVVELLKLISAASIDIIGHFAYSTDFKAIQINAPKYKRHALKSPNSIFARAYVEMFKTTWRGQRSLEAASLIGANIALALPLRAVKTIKSIMALVWQVSENIVTEHERAAEVSERKHTFSHQDNEDKTLGSTKTAAIREDMLSVAMRSGAFRTGISSRRRCTSSPPAPRRWRAAPRGPCTSSHDTQRCRRGCATRSAPPSRIRTRRSNRPSCGRCPISAPWYRRCCGTTPSTRCCGASASIRRHLRSAAFTSPKAPSSSFHLGP